MIKIKFTAYIAVLVTASALLQACSGASRPALPEDTPTVTASPSPRPSEAPAETPAASPSPSPSVTPEGTPEPSDTPEPAPTESPKPSLTPAPTPQQTAKPEPSPAPEDPSRKAVSWYYMKKGKGEVPGFPSETKQYKPEHRVIYVGTGKKVYLTFDTGGPLGDVDKMLQTLKDNDVKANYFLAGYNVKKHPDFLKRLVEDGHLVGNHTMTHKDLTTLTDEQVKQDLEEYERMYEEITGEPIPRFFRFPYGKYSMHLLDLVSGMDYSSVFWSTAMRDWEPRENGAEDPYNDIMNNLHDGNIILMHQGSEENIEALDRIIKAIKEEGYEFGLLTDFEQ
ncbi:polysaccharide deacetylase family protein [Paenibacillus sp. SAFN-117]|uniref:polysaccharide deacetylase family protein n=1 Tax=Paenibacillus sp. SAFN-117 TaxID=3436860 RepID=UPI003F82393D